MQVSMRAARINAGLTQEEASKLLDISEVTLRNWESGRSAPRANKLSDICRVYKCAIGDIFFNEKSR